MTSSNVTLQPMESNFSRKAWIMQYQSPGTGLIMCPGKFVFTNASAISRERAIRSGSVLETRIGMYSNQNDNRGLFYIIQTIIYKMYNVLAYC